MCGYGLRSLRWQRFLRPIKRVPLGSAAAVLMLGFAANNILPARVGELVRAHELGRRQQVSRVAALTTIALERVFDGVTLLLVLIVVLLASPAARDSRLFQTTGLLGGAVLVTAAVVLGLALWQESRLLAGLRWLVRPLPARLRSRLLRLVARLLEGLAALRSSRLMGSAVLLSLLVWSCEATSYFLILHAFNLPLSGGNFALAAGLLVAAVNLGIMVPSAPGYIGTFQVFAMIALGIFGVVAAQGLSVALVAHAMQYFLVTLIGLAIFLLGQSRRSWPAW